MRIRNYRILIISFCIALVIVLIKFLMHWMHWEVVLLGSLHTSVIAGTFFVVGFLLSASIADYKESEKIPAEFSATIENMAVDGAMMHRQYPDFDLAAFKGKLSQILEGLKTDMRDGTRKAHTHIFELHPFFLEMEKAGVPPNFIVKLKQEQATLTKSLFRVSYIQKIKFIPSTSIFTYAITILSISLLVVTEIEPFYGGMALTAIISLMLVYILLLIQLISTPFHSEGKTQDDVSMFLVDDVNKRLKDRSNG